MKSELSFLISMFVLSALVLGGCAPAFSDPVPLAVPTKTPTQLPVILPTEPAEYNPVVTIFPTSGEAGTLVEIVASGFPPNSPVSVGMGPANAGFGQVAQGITDANGTFIAHIPAQGGDGMSLVFAIAAEGQPSILSSNQFQITRAVPNPPQPTEQSSVIPTLTPYQDMWVDYSNPVFAVSLQYPADWVVESGYGSPETGEIKYAGISGFFQISAMETESIDMAAAAEAGHKLQPYGSNPTIESLQIQGQEARLILPSNDQPAGMQYQAGLIIRYPQPVNISGTPCHFFILWADEAHIRAISQTIRFTN